jgi:hypothetical protein
MRPVAGQGDEELIDVAAVGLSSEVLAEEHSLRLWA